MSLVWWPAPEAGDIMWCRFPQGKVLKAGPKPRPTLIVKVYDTHAPHFFVIIAYGTSQKTDRLHSGEFVLARRDAAAWPLSGLSYETKFDLGQTVELPFNSDWFAPPPLAPYGQNPKLGLLHPTLMRRVHAAWNAVKTSK